MSSDVAASAEWEFEDVGCSLFSENSFDEVGCPLVSEIS
jgi:hypothetical protein